MVYLKSKSIRNHPNFASILTGPPILCSRPNIKHGEEEKMSIGFYRLLKTLGDQFHNVPFTRFYLNNYSALQVRNELVLEERQAAVSALQRLVPAGAPPDAAVLEGAVPGLAQGSLARIRDAHTLFVSLESDTLASLGILLSTDTSRAVRETTTAIVGRMVREKVGLHGQS